VDAHHSQHLDHVVGSFTFHVCRDWKALP
jgi:hypothetical protein